MNKSQSRRIHIFIGLFILSFSPLSISSSALEPIAPDGTNPIHTCTELGPSSIGATALSETVWKRKKTLTVKFLDGSEALQSKVRYFAPFWSNYANIRFVFIEKGPSDIRVSFVHDGRSWSHIGNSAQTVDKKKATMNFGWFDESTSDVDFQGVILHEFGHALGLVHEHQSPNATIDFNKAAVYKHFSEPPFEWNENVVNDNFFNKYVGYRKRYTAYDPASIMQYPIPAAFTNNGYSVKFNSDLSAMDKALIKRLYP